MDDNDWNFNEVIYEKCRSCKWFVREYPQTLMCPGEPAECNHPVAFNSSSLPNFPFVNGCKHFEPK